MAKRLHKRDRITVRFTTAQVSDVRKAARVESDRRGELVEESTLVRELTLQGIERILADHAADQAA